MEMEEEEDTDDGSMSHLKRPRRNLSHVTQTIDSSTSEEEDSSNSQELSDDEDGHSLKSSTNSFNSRASGKTKDQQQERRKVKQANGKLLSRRPHGSSPERRFWCPADDCGYHGQKGNLNKHVQNKHSELDLTTVTYRRLDKNSLKLLQKQQEMEEQMAQLKKTAAESKVLPIKSSGKRSAEDSSKEKKHRRVTDLVQEDLKCSTTECSDTDMEVVTRTKATKTKSTVSLSMPGSLSELESMPSVSLTRLELTSTSSTTTMASPIQTPTPVIPAVKIKPTGITIPDVTEEELTAVGILLPSIHDAIYKYGMDHLNEDAIRAYIEITHKRKFPELELSLSQLIKATIIGHATKGPGQEKVQHTAIEDEELAMDMQVVEGLEKHRLSVAADEEAEVSSVKKKPKNVSAFESAKERRNARRREKSRLSREAKATLQKEQKEKDKQWKERQTILETQRKNKTGKRIKKNLPELEEQGDVAETVQQEVGDDQQTRDTDQLLEKQRKDKETADAVQLLEKQRKDKETADAVQLLEKQRKEKEAVDTAQLLKEQRKQEADQRKKEQEEQAERDLKQLQIEAEMAQLDQGLTDEETRMYTADMHNLIMTHGLNHLTQKIFREYTNHRLPAEPGEADTTIGNTLSGHQERHDGCTENK